MEITRSTAARRRGHHLTAHELGEKQAGVVTRAQLSRAGLSPAAIAANITANRWRPLGVHSIVLHCGPLDERAKHWSAVLEAGPRAYVDGASSLVLGGLKHFDATPLRVTVPRGARVRHRGASVDIRQTRRWNEDDIDREDVPRSRTPVAAVRAALWARSDRQADLVLTMTVQQKLATPGEIAAALLAVRRDRRRTRIDSLLLDLAGGVGSLGELDVLRGCRERGLPEPDLQALRRTSARTYYLDFRWSWFRVCLEVDGIQHGWVQNAIADALRHNTIALEGDIVLRLPVLGLKACPDDFFAQVEQALVSRGWRAPTSYGVGTSYASRPMGPPAYDVRG
ncbi:hypothetical protein EXE58_03010 [Nocardioides seonyuensis]|uniref:DUF559 domain-containing protein n=1 Tax=Nocardioides seonyuensis TaxID=2518371 RepID=A0A4P7ID17_9ACTN|nr:hypothetical protein [Nocardioides seonyuensis]QBX54540.1 hypothetical protein EXE58_03010 [Nocardioides seonyuensis]